MEEKWLREAGKNDLNSLRCRKNRIIIGKIEEFSYFVASFIRFPHSTFVFHYSFGQLLLDQIRRRMKKEMESVTCNKPTIRLMKNMT